MRDVPESLNPGTSGGGVDFGNDLVYRRGRSRNKRVFLVALF